ncbi:MAG: hypothetical protein R3A48_10005 [Polyangiales bacterium]
MFDEREGLDAWARAFRHVLGWAPSVTGSRGAISLRFDGPIEPLTMLGNTGHLAQSESLLAHARALGFGWDDAGVVRTVPSPDTFNARCADLLPPRAGYRMSYMRVDRRNMSLGSFLLRYLEGHVPVQLGSAAFYAAVCARRDRGLQGELGFHFTSFAHDLSVHALNYQVVPRALIDAIDARVREALPERVASWAAPEAEGPLTLTTFFDNDVNHYCYAVWSASATLREALTLGESLADELLRCLDRRIDETREGLGDVPSGDTDDMKPLSRWSFDAHAPRPTPAVAPVAPAASASLAQALLGVSAVPAELPALRARLVDARLDGDAAALLVGWEHPVARLRVTADGEGVRVEVSELHPSASRLRAGLAALATRLQGAHTAESLARAVERARG